MPARPELSEQRRTNARGRRTREHIERTALELMAADGFDATTVDVIAAAAGVSRRTFFHHFASKTDVLWGDSFDRLNEFAVLLHSKRAPDLRAALLATIVEWAALQRSDELDVLRFRVVQGSGLAAEHVIVFQSRFREMLAEWLAARTGRAAGDVAVRAAAQALDALRQFVVEEWARDPGQVELGDLARTALDTVEIELPPVG